MAIRYRHTPPARVQGAEARLVGFGEQKRINDQIEAQAQTRLAERFSGAIGDVGASVGGAFRTGILERYREQRQADHDERVSRTALDRIFLARYGIDSATATQEANESGMDFADYLDARRRMFDEEKLDQQARLRGLVPQRSPLAEAEVPRLQSEISTFQRMAGQGDIPVETALREIDKRERYLDSIDKPIYVRPAPKLPSIQEEIEAGEELWIPPELRDRAVVTRGIRNGSVNRQVDIINEAGAGQLSIDKQVKILSQIEKEIRQRQEDILFEYNDAVEKSKINKLPPPPAPPVWTDDQIRDESYRVFEGYMGRLQGPTLGIPGAVTAPAAPPAQVAPTAPSAPTSPTAQAVTPEEYQTSFDRLQNSLIPLSTSGGSAGIPYADEVMLKQDAETVLLGMAGRNINSMSDDELQVLLNAANISGLRIEPTRLTYIQARLKSIPKPK